VSDAALTEAYQRFHRTGPEWGADQLTNHGPMAVEVLVRRGRAEAVPGWVDAYIRRLDELPRATGEITDASWPEALGDGRADDLGRAFGLRERERHLVAAVEEQLCGRRVLIGERGDGRAVAAHPHRGVPRKLLGANAVAESLPDLRVHRIDPLIKRHA